MNRLIITFVGSLLCAGLFAVPERGGGWSREATPTPPAAYLDGVDFRSRGLDGEPPGTVNVAVIGLKDGSVDPLVSLVALSPHSSVPFFRDVFAASEIPLGGRLVPLLGEGEYALVWFTEDGRVRVKPTRDSHERVTHTSLTGLAGAKPVYLYSEVSSTLEAEGVFVNVATFGVDRADVGDCVSISFLRAPKTNMASLDRRVVKVSDLGPEGLTIPIFETKRTATVYMSIAGTPVLVLN